jgi:hypothetical protein
MTHTAKALIATENQNRGQKSVPERATSRNTATGRESAAQMEASET